LNRAGPGCLNKISASTSGASARVAVVLAAGMSGRAISSWPVTAWLRGHANEGSSNLAPEHNDQDDHGDEKERRIKLSEAQVEAAGIVLAEVRGGELQHHFLVPGTIITDQASDH
jgi:hypothetical protein